MGLQVTALFAYLDPGTGSMLLQLLLAGALTAAHLAGARLGKLKTFVLGLVRNHG